jgi:hypothetical protein
MVERIEVTIIVAAGDMRVLAMVAAQQRQHQQQRGNHDKAAADPENTSGETGHKAGDQQAEDWNGHRGQVVHRSNPRFVATVHVLRRLCKCVAA